MDQDTADEYCEALASRHYMQVDELHYDSIPVEARGIPHLAIPGLHSYLDEYYQSMLTLRKDTHPGCHQTKEYPTVQSLACLPFTPFAQALAPGTTEELDTTRQFAFRNRADQMDMDGRCFLNDNTVEDMALLREPLFPRVQIHNAADNPFELADDHVDSFFNAAATVAIMVNVHFGNCGPEFKPLLALANSFHGKCPPCEGMEVMADLMVLFNAMYPTTFEVAKPHILRAYSDAPSRSHKAAKYQRDTGRSVEGLRLTDIGLPEKDVQEAQRYQQRFFDLVFPELSPLLTVLLEMNGSYDLSPHQVHDVSTKLEQAVRGAWFLASPDGELPPYNARHPLEGVACPARVNAMHVAPRVVDREQPEGTWEQARGALVGMTPGGYRQLMSMLVASSTMEVSVQVYRNYGGLLLRPSAAPDILTKEGKQRSEKAISPMGVEGDQLAWGSREGKLRNCKRQRKAWKANTSIIKKLCVNVSKPVPADERLQADDSCTPRDLFPLTCKCSIALYITLLFAGVEYVRSRVISHGQVGTKTKEEIDSLNAFNLAVAPVI